MITYIKKTSVVTLAVLLAFGANILLAADWTPPTGTAPHNNVDAPINISGSPQIKLGVLTVGGLLSMGGGYFHDAIGVATAVLPLPSGLFPGDLVGLFNGKIGATAYCNITGTHCVNADDLGGGGTGGDGLPAGAVMSFDLASCPTGWSSYAAAAGRNIIGVGTATGAAGATSHTKGQTGGEEKHSLTRGELPSDINLFIKYARAYISGESYTNVISNQSSASYGLGSDEAHNIMDPYVALLYCKKI